MSVLAITRAASRRLLRDRTALFFLLVLPVVLIVIVGTVAHAVTGFRVAVLDRDATAASRSLIADLRQTPGLHLSTAGSLASLERAVARADVDVGVVIPDGLGAAGPASATATIRLLAEPANGTQQAASAAVAPVIARAGSRVQAAQFATRYASSYRANLGRANALAPSTAAVELRRSVVPATARTLPSGYEYSAPTELVLFVFLTAVAGGAALIETRRLGMLERMAAAPIGAATIILGESLTYVAIALAQSLLLVGIGALAFGVSWGDPLGAGALVLVWCLVGAGAGMVAGTLFRTPEQASAIGPVVGIAFGMLGGCMWPLAIVSPVMRTLGHLTPHAWAIDAWTTLLAGHGDIGAIGWQLGVLALCALALFLIAALRLRRAIAAGAR